MCCCNQWHAMQGISGTAASGPVAAGNLLHEMTGISWLEHMAASDSPLQCEQQAGALSSMLGAEPPLSASVCDVETLIPGPWTCSLKPQSRGSRPLHSQP